jgi:hypothetical protein
MPSVTLILADGTTETVDVADEQELNDLLNRAGKYATGWIRVPDAFVNVTAVVKVRPGPGL